MLQYTLESICKTFKSFLNLGIGNQPKEGPNSLEELLEQFDSTPKQKTDKDIIRDYQIKETMANLELEMLKMEPTLFYRGSFTYHDSENNKYFDWVYCSVRPEVLYCCNNRN